MLKGEEGKMFVTLIVDGIPVLRIRAVNYSL
jgi:hypothetical protein